MSFADILSVRQDVLQKGGIEGIIDIQNLLDKNKQSIEMNPQQFFDLTFATSDIQKVVNNLNLRFKKQKDAAGLFLFEGYKGSGKSHLAVLVYHLIKNQAAAQAWLSRFKIKCELPGDLQIIVHKFTDFPIETSLWDIVFSKLGDQGRRRTNLPSLDELRQVVANRKIVLIFDELERGLLSLPQDRLNQNLSFLQMLTEEANRSQNASLTLIASVYDSQREPGSTLKRTPRIEVKFSDPVDKQKMVLHRLFSNSAGADKERIENVIVSYANYWKNIGAPVNEKYLEKLRESFPFTPELMEAILFHIPLHGGFQGNRSALGLLGALVRNQYRTADLISLAHLSLVDSSIRNRLADLDSSQRVIQCAQNDFKDLEELSFAGEIISCTMMATLAHAGHLPGIAEHELIRQVLKPCDDINRYHATLQALQRLGTYFQFQEGKYYFDEREKPSARVEYRSLQIAPDAAVKYAMDCWKNMVFNDSKAVVYREAAQARNELADTDANSLRFVFAPKRLDQRLRLELFQGLENQNLIILLEPKKDSFNGLEDADILRWAQRALAARELAESASDADRRKHYERIENDDTGFILNAFKQAGLQYVWLQNSETGTGVWESELEPLGSALTRVDVTKFINEQIFLKQRFEEHLLNRLTSIQGKSVKTVDAEYKKTLGFPVRTAQSVFLGVIKNLCLQKKIGLVHEKGKACGRNPDFSDVVLLDAQITEPFEDIGPLQVDWTESRPVSTETPQLSGRDDGEDFEKPRESIPVKQMTTLQTTFVKTIGALRQEIASRLVETADAEISRIQFQIFMQQDRVDLDLVPAAFRGAIKGLGDLTLDLTISKNGPLSKAQVEQLVECLPQFKDASYRAEIKQVR